VIAASVSVASFLLLVIYLSLRHWASVATSSNARSAEDLRRLQRAFRGR
jgi:hypothetical protein